MSASWSGSMRGPRVKTPFLLLLLLLLSALTGTVLCGDYNDGGGPSTEEAVPEDADGETSESSASTANLDTAPTTTALTEQSPEEGNPGEAVSTTTITTTEDDGISGSGEPPVSSVEPSTEEDSLNPIIILIPVVLVVVIIGMIVCGIFINRRWKKKASHPELGRDDPYLEGSSTEKVPMPMFEEDVPSVLELEMEELDQWMKKEEDSKHA